MTAASVGIAAACTCVVDASLTRCCLEVTSDYQVDPSYCAVDPATSADAAK